ncbi:MAG: AmmeMemoRadiSam system radical SAM enzyme [Lentisphaeria bacterium]
MTTVFRIVFAAVLAAVSGAWPVCAGADAAAAGWPASWWEALPDGRAGCRLCPRRCNLADGERGVCGVRINRGGKLMTLDYGNPVALHVDPIEKKPFFHVWPGAAAYSIGLPGCNMRCKFCQNWEISQSIPEEAPAPETVLPAAIPGRAMAAGCPFVVFTYTEPAIFFEYMRDTARAARAAGLRTGMHTCGYINPEPLQELLPLLDAVNVDLKGFTRDFYRKYGALAELDPVLNTLRQIHAAGVWLEITTLVIPGANDDPEDLRRMCRWIRDNLGADTPLHFTRFMPAFRLRNLPPTPVRRLELARRIALECGLRFVYIGNVPGHPAEHTYCPGCGRVVIRRVGYVVQETALRADGHCAACGRVIPGLWPPVAAPASYPRAPAAESTAAAPPPGA